MHDNHGARVELSLEWKEVIKICGPQLEKENSCKVSIHDLAFMSSGF